MDVPSTDVFDLLGQEARMSILETLVDADADAAPGDPVLSFSDLKRRSDIEDTGRFNYHLGELVGTLVVKTDGGYRLSKFGRRLLRPMTTGYYDPQLSIVEVDLPGSCPICGSSLQVVLREGVLQVACTDDHVVNHGIVGSPGLVAEHDPEDAATAIGVLTTHAVELGTNGVCPTCHGPVEGGVVRIDSPDCFVFRAPCDACGNRFTAPVGGCVSTHPEVVGRYAAEGVDLRTAVPWTRPFRQAGAEDLVSRDPFRVGLEVGEELPGNSLYVTLDRDGEVRAIHRVPP